MATKSIMIDVEAYERLNTVRREDESFSRVIKRVVRPPVDVDAYLAHLDGGPHADLGDPGAGPAQMARRADG